VRTMVRMAGLALAALLLAAPAAGASTLSLQGGVVTYSGDAADDVVKLTRFVEERDNDKPNDDRIYYLVTDNAQLQPGEGCFQISDETSGCRVQQSLARYALNSGAGNDTVQISGDNAGGTADLGAGNDRFTGGTSADAVSGRDGDDVIRPGAGSDRVDGGSGADQVAGEAGTDVVGGGAGNDQLEFGGAQMAAGAGAGADDIRGGSGTDRLSYNDHSAAVRVVLDDRGGDGSTGENDNVHRDVETVVGSTLNDVLIGGGGNQDLFGHGGLDRIDGGDGDDLLNGGTGDDELYGGAGADRLEGSADEDYLEGGAGQDFFEGDNVCSASPCTGASDFIQARDGEPDTVNCGVGADTAVVDAVDVVAQDNQHGCERVDRPAGQVVAPPGGVLGQGTAPGVATIKVVGVRRFRTLRRGKLRVEVNCPSSCSVSARLIAGRTVAARQTRTRLGAGIQNVRPRLTRKGRKLIRRRTKLVTTLVVDVRDDQARTTTLTRVLRFRR
jgi:Ca2+-binding RTX toxin-like protein